MSSEVLLAIWDDVEQPPSVVDFAPDWIEPFVPMRSRVIRDVEYVGLELPDVESLTAEPVEADLHSDLDLTDDSDQSADTANSGAAAIAWAVAYRDGLEQGRRDGLASGYAEGTREGFAAAREEGRLAVEQTINAMSAQVDEILTALDRTAAAVATDATSLGLGVAEAVLDHELRTSADPGAEAIARAARLVPDTSSNGADQLMVRLN
ncbi:MAG TPA: hypothetical protein VL068_11660, partial [Microthrixaceae bacterium]|nr:hypothetical protein [Microthrixaceae bacterium]